MDTLSVLQRLGSGQLLEELHAALVTAAEEVVATGKPGKVTLTLTLSNRQVGDPLVVIDEQISRTSPKKDPRGAIFFAVGGGLYREDPRQIPLDFKTVDTSTGEIRDVAPERAERTIRG